MVQCSEGKAKFGWSSFPEGLLGLWDQGPKPEGIIVPEVRDSLILSDQALLYPEGHGDGFPALESSSVLGV